MLHKTKPLCIIFHGMFSPLNHHVTQNKLDASTYCHKRSLKRFFIFNWKFSIRNNSLF